MYIYNYIHIERVAGNNNGSQSQQLWMLGSFPRYRRDMVSIQAWLNLIQAVGMNATQVVCTTVYTWYGEQTRR